MLGSNILESNILEAMMRFVGRERELRSLEEAYSSGSFQLQVIYGRRRVRKTVLIKRFI